VSIAVEAVRGACRAFGSRPDSRLEALDPFAPPDRPAGALLLSILAQDLTFAGAARLLRELHGRLGDRVLSASPSDWSELEGFAARAGWLRDWPHREAMPGWILSAGDFVRSHGPPERWPESFEPEVLVRTLASELPWMGARSSHRIKAWRLCRWLGRAETGGPGGGSEPFRRGLRVPHAAVERPLKTVSVLPPGWELRSSRERQEWVDAMAAQSSPGDPAAIWPALDAILSRGHAGPACQEFLGGCRNCPLRRRCPSPGAD
jgi:hypothetical protein